MRRGRERGWTRSRDDVLCGRAPWRWLDRPGGLFIHCLLRDVRMSQVFLSIPFRCLVVKVNITTRVCEICTFRPQLMH